MHTLGDGEPSPDARHGRRARRRTSTTSPDYPAGWKGSAPLDDLGQRRRRLDAGCQGAVRRAEQRTVNGDAVELRGVQAGAAARNRIRAEPLQLRRRRRTSPHPPRCAVSVDAGTVGAFDAFAQNQNQIAATEQEWKQFGYDAALGTLTAGGGSLPGCRADRGRSDRQGRRRATRRDPGNDDADRFQGSDQQHESRDGQQAHSDRHGRCRAGCRAAARPLRGRPARRVSARGASGDRGRRDRLSARRLSAGLPAAAVHDGDKRGARSRAGG